MSQNIRTELVQSYIITTSKYDFTVYEKRILYRIIAVFQDLMKDVDVREKYDIKDLMNLSKSNENYTITLFGDAEISMPLNLFLADSKDKNYKRIKTAFKSLMQKIIEYENGDEWEAFALIESPSLKRCKKDTRVMNVNFRLNVQICNALFDFSKGFRSYELEVAWKFNSAYTMRFYELFSKQQKPITYSISTLRKMFNLENKYKRTADFITYIIDRSKKELDEHSPYSFNYVTLPKDRGRTTPITSVTFVPYKQKKHLSEDLVKRESAKSVSLNWYLTRQEIDYLLYKVEFTPKELKAHTALFRDVKKVLQEGELLDILANMKRSDNKGIEVKNKKGYVINTLKKIVSEN